MIHFSPPMPMLCYHDHYVARQKREFVRYTTIYLRTRLLNVLIISLASYDGSALSPVFAAFVFFEFNLLSLSMHDLFEILEDGVQILDMFVCSTYLVCLNHLECREEKNW